MASRTSLMLRGLSPYYCCCCFFNLSSRSSSSSSKLFFLGKNSNPTIRYCSTKATGGASSLPPPDVTHLAKTARISLAPNEVEEFAPKIQQVIDWFGQLQVVDLDSVEPAIRAESLHENAREDIPETFENREAIRTSVPSYDDPYIKVPKVLNKE
ncbi:hypothetical protein SLEP1_g21422 [Rubroshorea leprosula]|uniref:Glutamyl-tRNA(Gln) amidotransferase subunit C, chloroplastic/mitochondrial n=1 Tax=Rubroshorea leprosula TaxID=152421 RepID=A0AAV5JF54_9ROSI|nr:hypothetical protein SLEP1_g21422 [Rubroshorea leprosula]